MDRTVAEKDFLRSRFTSPVAFLAGILLFLLPFVEVRCNDAPFVQNTGIGLALGRDYKVIGQMKAFRESFEEESGKQSGISKESGKLYVFALAALLLGVAGLVFSIINGRLSQGAAILGILGALALIGLMIHLKMDVTDKAKSSGGEDGFGSHVEVTAHFTAWYWLSLLCFIGASFLSYLRWKGGKKEEIPPVHAPQIKIDNPGEQSEFPTSASESDIG